MADFSMQALSGSYMKIGLGLLTAAFLVGGMQGAVIDFEDLNVAPGMQLNPAINVSQVSGGFILVSPGADLHFHNQDGFGDNMSTHLGAHAFVDFSLVSGTRFSLTQFDFDYFLTDPGSIMVIGTIAGGGVTVQTFPTDGMPSSGSTSSYQTFTLNNTFANLTSVRIDSGERPNSTAVNGFFVDNIVWTPVPEPASIILLASGLAGIGLVIRKRFHATKLRLSPLSPGRHG